MERMTVRLRGHHLLCLLGYRGMGYSKAYTENMTAVYGRLRDNPSTSVTIVEGVDDLCSCFPSDQEYHCDREGVFRHDRLVLDHLGLSFGDTLAWEQLLERIRRWVAPERIGEWCAGCRWRSYGVCEAGLARLAAGGEGLPALPTLTPSPQKEPKQT
ncbi:DUF1284 domain-containing protein [Paenibacillus silviterrae]|uniref:DUF1284 domain-containing protein n=1 Tax=Paenibacillus silviterrae TaxID=3242194 RepID=UPI002543F5DF|nr:DUF1284 domain-containing protein [Paenibacillus chinjuensis]